MSFDEQFELLCQAVQDVVPEEIGTEAWYLIIATILIASPNPELLGMFYTYVTSHNPSFHTPEAQEKLSYRLRDILLKLVTVVGGPQVLSALIPLAKAEGDPEVKAEKSELSEKWSSFHSPSSIHARGKSTIDTIYGPTLLPQLFSSFGQHSKDIEYMELFTIYGLYMSDFTVMTPVETETIVLVAILCTGLPIPSLWHVRGLGRLLGARGSDESTPHMEKIKNCLRAVKMAAIAVVEFVDTVSASTGNDLGEFSRKVRLENWPNVGDVSRQLNGWGDDQ